MAAKLEGHCMVRVVQKHQQFIEVQWKWHGNFASFANAVILGFKAKRIILEFFFDEACA
jgi:hypothetical protein